MSILSSLACFLVATMPASDTRILHPEEQRDFYRGGGRDLIGEEIQLKIDSKVLRKTPLEVRAKAGGRLLIFENRSVPIVIPDRLAYWRQASRHLHDASAFLLKGRLFVRREDKKQRVHLYVTRIKRAHGAW